jgi:DNA-directed RNA polymerase specialized sigma24 family protein
MNLKNTAIAHRFIFTATDEELLDQLDELVAAAAGGERDAVGALLIAFGPMLTQTARAALGPVHEQDAPDVVQDFAVCLLEEKLRFPAVRRSAIPWMKRMMRLLAQAHLRTKGPDRDMAG